MRYTATPTPVLGGLHHSTQFAAASVAPCTALLDCSWCSHSVTAVQRTIAPATAVGQHQLALWCRTHEVS